MPIYYGNFSSDCYSFFGYSLVYGDIISDLPSTDILSLTTFEATFKYKGNYRYNESVKYIFNLDPITKTFKGTNNGQMITFSNLIIKGTKVNGEYLSMSPYDKGTFNLSLF